MADRYKRIYDLGGARYAEGAPVLICAGAMLQDKLSRSTLVQLKLKNIGDEEITAVKLRISPFDAAERPVEPVEYTYQNVKARRDQEFGSKTAIVIPDQGANSFEVCVLEVIFSDKSRWENSGELWTAVKSPRSMEQVFGDAELSTQFAIRYGSDCTHFPEEDRDLWFCACGLINHESESKCHSCRRVRSALMSINFKSLQSESLQRQENEKQSEDEDKAQLDIKKRKFIKLSLIMLPVLICFVLVLATVPKYVAQKNDYAAAEALLSAGKYDMAQQAFAALGDYADSEEQAKYNVAYQKALYIIDCAAREDVDGLLLLGMKRSELADGETVGVALYKAADAMFAQLGDYKDSPVQCSIAQSAVQAYYDSVILAEYEAAVALLDSGSYLQARDAFVALGDYSDSAELATEALYQRAVQLYQLCEKYSMQGVFSNISNTVGTDSVFYITETAFADLGSTASGDIRSICRGDGVEINISDPPAEGFTPICKDISRLFTELGSYKDSADYAAKAIEAGDFTKPFYRLCEEGKLYEAYTWLEAYTDEFEARQKWMEVLETYGPYCGVWELKSGDPTLIPMTLGVQASCGMFTSAVVIKDYVITLYIYINGNTEYAIQLPLAAGGGHFSFNHDGVNTFIAALSQKGTFNYSHYSSYAISSQTNSCEYTRLS